MAESLASLKVLVGVDDSDSATAAVAHVLRVFPGPERPQLVLVHVLVQKIPPHLEFIDPSMVWDGAGLPTALQTETAEHVARDKQAAAERVREIFRDLDGGRWPEERLTITVVEGGFTRAAIAEVLTFQAREVNADIVVVGRTHHGALHDALIKSTGQRLVQACKATAAWVVGAPRPTA